MISYKLDIKEMTETYNNSVYFKAKYTDSSYRHITQEEMSEMVQKHAFKLGYKWRDNGCQYVRYKGENIALDKTGIRRQLTSVLEDYEKIGLEFFSIKPEKFVTVRMPESDWIATRDEGDNLTMNVNYMRGSLDKWELVE